MKRRELRAMFPNASPGFITANSEPDSPELPWQGREDKKGASTPVRAELEQRAPARAPRKKQSKAEDTERFLVRITSVRGVLIDEDNLCPKYIVDCCRYAGLLPDDRPGKTSIQTAQRKAGEGEEEHTLVEIFAL